MMKPDMELDGTKDYPFRSSLTKVARCGMCAKFTSNCYCTAGNRVVWPLINGEHDCKDYVYQPDPVFIRPPRYPECEICAHWFQGICSGIEWWTVRTRSICEFYRDARLICEHAVPFIQYGDHNRNNYCSLPPEERDGDARYGWKWCCPQAHTRYAESRKCYRAKRE